MIILGNYGVCETAGSVKKYTQKSPSLRDLFAESRDTMQNPKVLTLGLVVNFARVFFV